jgi:hypothetical protein
MFGVERHVVSVERRLVSSRRLDVERRLVGGAY